MFRSARKPAQAPVRARRRNAQSRPMPKPPIITRPAGLVGDGTTGIGGRVGVVVAVLVGVAVTVRVKVAVAVLLGVTVLVAVSVAVAVFVNVAVGVSVGVLVGVVVGVLVGVLVGAGGAGRLCNAAWALTTEFAAQ